MSECTECEQRWPAEGAACLTRVARVQHKAQVRRQLLLHHHRHAGGVLRHPCEMGRQAGCARRDEWAGSVCRLVRAWRELILRGGGCRQSETALLHGWVVRAPARAEDWVLVEAACRQLARKQTRWSGLPCSPAACRLSTARRLNRLAHTPATAVCSAPASELSTLGMES